jgi:hypothetical protein
MPSCRNEGWRRLSGVAALAALVQLATTAACAELGAPMPLNGPPPESQRAAAAAPPADAAVPDISATPAPPVPPPPTALTDEAAPATPAAPPAPAAPPVPAPPTALTGPAAPAPAAAAPAAPAGDESIVATPLAPPDPTWASALGDGDHPLPANFWQGTPRSLVATLLPQLGPTASPAWHDLARRLLLSGAAPPQGQDTPDHPSLAGLRVERLKALGEIAGARAVLDVLPSAMRNGDDLDRDQVELAFAANDVARGCRAVQDGIARQRGAWWDRALIACQALAGDQAKASLGLSLLREEKAPADPTFDALIDSLRGHATKLQKLPDPSPIRVALVAAAKLPLPADAVAAADLPTLREWATNDAVPALQRLAAAERAALLGALPPQALADLYAKVEFKPEEIGAAIKQNKAPETPRDRALLFAVARTGPAQTVRAKALGALLADGRKRGSFATIARVVTPLLADLPPSAALAALAPDATRAFYVAGEAEPAAQWLAVADPKSAPALALIARLALGEAGPAHDVDALKATLSDLVRRAPDKATLAVTLLGAFADPAAQDIVLDNSYAGKSANATLMLNLVQAAAAKHLGETVLVALIVLRSDDRLTQNPLALAQAAGSLRAVGLESEARALAVEAALDAGI